MAQLKLGLSKRSSFNLVSKLITIVQGTPYSHAYVKIPMAQFDREIIFQASGFAVNFEAETLFNSQDTIVEEYEYDISDDTMTQVVQFALDQVGKPYSMLEFIGFGWILVCQIFGKKVVNPFGNSGSSYICSVLVATVLQDIGDSVTGDISSVSPKDLEPLLKKYATKQLV